MDDAKQKVTRNAVDISDQFCSMIAQEGKLCLLFGHSVMREREKLRRTLTRKFRSQTVLDSSLSEIWYERLIA
jgi:hypothetical protein